MVSKTFMVVVLVALAVSATAIAQKREAVDEATFGTVEVTRTEGHVVKPLVIPWHVNYQGYLTDDAGSPINDTVGMTFRIYTASAGGTELWNEGQSVVIEDGIFSTVLGTVTPISPDVFGAGASRWLELTVEAQILSPRTEITSVGYAYRSVKTDSADYADMVDGFDASVAPTANDLFPLSYGDAQYVNEGQADAITTSMVVDGTLLRADVAPAFKAPYADTADYAFSAPGVSDSHWTLTGNVLHPSAGYGLAMRSSNILHGSQVNTHVNLGVTCTTGTSGENWPYCTVSGGYQNASSGRSATVGGGESNMADSAFAVVGGGERNWAVARYATSGGGQDNVAAGEGSFVGGGVQNTASGRSTIVGGGETNAASGDLATLGGGVDNQATGQYATVGGGAINTASGISATVGGGYINTASDSGATISGGYHNYANQIYATIGGGYADTASGLYATVGGGRSCAARSAYSTIGGGENNIAGDIYATIGGGDGNVAGSFGTVGGGADNTATFSYATVGGGALNAAFGTYSTVAGGYHDTCNAAYGFAVGLNSIVPGAHVNSAAFNGQTATASGQTRVGALSKASGSFTIDHPLEPMRKILNHYFVESPEMVLIYRGVAHIGADGRAAVHLPDYFDALNRNPMIQLTGVGTYEVFIAEKVSGNRFVIGGEPGTEVHWTVTGDRKDPSAEITRIIMPVEQAKDGDLAGRSLDDDFLATTKAQLDRMGEGGHFSFRTAWGRHKFEQSQRALLENK